MSDRDEHTRGQALSVASYAYANSRFFHRHLAAFFAAPPDIRKDFHALPFTDGALLAAHGEEMLCVSLGAVARIRTFHTSKTTGAAKRIFFSDADLARTVAFFAGGMRLIAPPDRPTLICMSDEKPDSIADLLRTALAGIGRSSRILGRPRDLRETAAAAESAGCLVGLPADLFYLCRMHPDLRPASVLLSADYVSPSLVAGMEETWNCPVYTHYGLTESGYALAVQCRKRTGMHIRDTDYLVEIVDPDSNRPLPPGSRCEIVLTSLHPSAMPLIRYRTGDIGSLSPDICACGNPSSVLTRVYGRYENLKQPVNIHGLDDILYAIPGVAAYEAHLANGSLYLTIEQSRAGGLDQTDQIDAASLEKRIGYPVHITCGHVPPWAQNGKRVLR